MRSLQASHRYNDCVNIRREGMAISICSGPERKETTGSMRLLLGLLNTGKQGSVIIGEVLE